MKKRCIIRSPVYREVIEQAEYYGQHSGDELAFRFYEAAEATYRFLLRNPSIGKPCGIPRHRALGVRESGILIRTVSKSSRWSMRPGTWKRFSM